MEKKLRDKVGQLALENSQNGKMSCSEAVMDALRRAGAVEAPPEVQRMMAAFGGGGGGSGNTCGVLSAALGAAAIARTAPAPAAEPLSEEERAARKDSNSRCFNNLVSDFKKLEGSALCREMCARHESFQSASRQAMCRRLITEGAMLACDYIQKSPEECSRLPFRENVYGKH